MISVDGHFCYLKCETNTKLSICEDLVIIENVLYVYTTLGNLENNFDYTITFTYVMQKKPIESPIPKHETIVSHIK